MTDFRERPETGTVASQPLRVDAPPPAPDAPPPPSFRDIFETQGNYVWNTLRRLGAQERDLEDLAHDVFVTVHRRFADYDPSRPLKPWLFGICLRVAMRYRDLARHRREVMDVDVEPADDRPDAEALLVRKQARDLVAEAMEALDMDRRAVFVMHEIDGEGIPEVAEALGIPLNTAYSRLRRARELFEAAVKRIRLRRGLL